MSIERLAFESEAPYRTAEATIHTARYLIARPFVAGKRVLDIACGEGYGSFLMSKWGAASVSGVDISQEAVDVAKRKFGSKTVDFTAFNADLAHELFPKGSFDVIVSLETIEHLTDPQRYLRAIKTLAAPGAVIIISCPNDHWYYPTDDEKNEFHIRKYTLKEFQDLTTAILGKKASWGVGGPVNGFATLELTAANTLQAVDGQASMVTSVAASGTLFVPHTDASRLTEANCSYFVGAWGAKLGGSSAVALTSMDDFLDPNDIPGMKKGFGRVAELDRLVLEYTARIHEIEGVVRGHEQFIGKQADALKESALEISRLDWLIQSYKAQEQVTADRFSELSAKQANLEKLNSELSAKQANLEKLNAEYGLIVSEYNRIKPVVLRAQKLWRMIPAPLRTLMFSTARTALRLVRQIRA